MSKKHRSLQQQSRLAGLLFFSPWLIGFISITLFPLIYSVVISINEVTILPSKISFSYVGGDYYIYALLKDEKFPLLLLEEVGRLALSLPIILVFSLVVAMLLNRKIVGRSFFRSVFFLPVIIISGPVLSQLINETKAMQFSFGLGLYTDKLVEQITSWTQFLVQTLWFSGVQTLIMLAALQKIDASLYEAASIDGATSWEMFWRITLPYIRKTLVLCGIYTVVEIGSVSTNLVNAKILNHLLEVGRPFSYSAAMSWLYAILQLLFILVVYMLLKEKRERGAKV